MRSNAAISLWLFTLIFLDTPGTAGNPLQSGSATFDEARVAILWSRTATGASYNDQASFASAFRSVNIQVDTLSPGSLDNLQVYNLLIIPNYSSGKLSGADPILQFVKNGGNLIIDGRSGLAEALGFTFPVTQSAMAPLAPSSAYPHRQDDASSAQLKISRMLDRFYPEDTLRLAVAEKLTGFAVHDGDEVLCRDASTSEPLVVGRRYGNGRIIYFGILFDPVSTGGYSRFPFLLQYVWNFLNIRPILRREFLEMYFDPGFRHNDDIDSLVQHWERNGVRVVHAAGWHQHPTWTYNYARLIEACHVRGMLVYAWLEPPHVSEKFWKHYPEWQEVNYLGEPIPPHWRYLEALTDSACREKVKAEYAGFLSAYDWDGVNLAELCFESERGPRKPRLYTPMHPSARTEFKDKKGFDPASLFDARSPYYWRKNHKALNWYERFRSETIQRLHEEFLTMIEGVRTEKRRFDVVVTAFDDIGSPGLRSYLGADVKRLIKLQKKYRFTLQIEDPQSRWSGDPRRYERMGSRYRKLFGKNSQVMIDLNILRFRDTKKSHPFPTKIQTGIECYQMVRSASASSDRVTIYSESTLRDADAEMLAYAASAPASIVRLPDGWKVTSPFPVALQLPERYTSVMLSTGEQLTSDRGRFELPEGEYILLKSK